MLFLSHKLQCLGFLFSSHSKLWTLSYKKAVAIVIFISFSAVQAQEVFQNDFNSLLYVQVSFDGENKASEDDSMKLGLTVNNTYASVSNMGGVNLFAGNNLSVNYLDIQLSSKTKYFSKFNISGVDALTYRTVMNANGTSSSWVSGLSTTQIVLGAIAGAAIGYGISEAISDDDEGCPEGQVIVRDGSCGFSLN